MKPGKLSVMVRACLATGVLMTSAVRAQVLAAADWTPQERQWVDNLNEVYRKQGMTLSQEQANAAVQDFRAKTQVAHRGIPAPEWTPREASMVSQYRAAYQKQGLPFTDDQAALAVQAMRDQIARLSGSIAVAQVLSSHGVPTLPMNVMDAGPANPIVYADSGAALSEPQLAAQIDALPSKSGDVQVRQRREGFTVNGQAVVDAEGRITMYSFDVISGDVTFEVQTPNGFQIKFMRAGAPVAPLLIATITRSGNGWSVHTVTGQRLAGDSVSMMPRGLLVARPGAAFRYVPGQGVKTIAIPDGYVLASIQRGNIGNTGYVLLEHDTPSSDSQGVFASVKALGGSLKAIGANLGVNSKADYALYNGENGKTYPLNIDTEGKEVTILSDCYRRSALVSRCNSGETFESLYDDMGRRNIRHYYWRAQWLNTPRGPIAITLEGGNRDAYITDLASGKKVVAFHRALGIADMEVTQNPDGSVSIDAQLAFQHQVIPDAVAFLDQASPVSVVASTLGTP